MSRCEIASDEKKICCHGFVVDTRCAISLIFKSSMAIFIFFYLPLNGFCTKDLE